MTDKRNTKIRLIYGILLSVLLIVTGILLMLACVSVYNIGPRSFTPENISSAFNKVSLAVWITLLALAIGCVIALVFPAPKNKPVAIKDRRLTLSLLTKRINTDECSPELLEKLEKERKLCIIFRISALMLCILFALPAIIYCFNFTNFTADYDASVIKACAWILPCTFFCMGVCVALVYLERASIERQILLAKAALTETCGGIVKPVQEKKPSYERIILGIRITLAALAVVFIVLGIFNGGVGDVLSKAVNICTECIGLG